MKKKTYNLKDRQEINELMKLLYGQDEAKDDQETCNTYGKAGTTSASQMAQPSPNLEKLLLQEQQ